MKGLFRATRGRPVPDWDEGAPDALVAELATLARSMDPASSDPRVSATRASVLGAFAAAGAAPGTALRADRPPAHRPALALTLAGALLVAVTVGAAASTPGLPLYGLRLAVEELVLPDAPALRDVAQLDRLDERLREASAAAAAGDGGALRASLGEYARIAESVAARVGPDEVALSRVRLQLETLEGLTSSDPLGVGERVRARTAALTLIRAFGGADGAAPSPPVAPVPSSAPGSGGMQSPGVPGPSTAPGPGDSGGPRASSVPRRSGDPGAGGAGPGGPDPAPTSDPGRGAPGSGSGGSGGSGAGGPDPAPTSDPGRGDPGSGSEGSGGSGGDPASSSDPGRGDQGSDSGSVGSGGGSGSGTGGG